MERRVRCVVACYDGADFPDLVAVTVVCEEAAYDAGLHFQAASDWVLGHGYNGPTVVFDENSGKFDCFNLDFDDDAQVTL